MKTWILEEVCRVIEVTVLRQHAHSMMHKTTEVQCMDSVVFGVSIVLTAQTPFMAAVIHL